MAGCSYIVLAVVLKLSVISQLSLACSPGSACHLGYSCTSCSTNATCVVARSCPTDYSKTSQLQECSKRSGHIEKAPATFTKTDTIYECPNSKLCADRSKLNESYRYLRVKSVRWQERPVNASHFALDVLWDWEPFADSVHLIPVHIILGFTLNIWKDDTLIKCLCIKEPTRLNISLGVEEAFRYDSAKNKNLKLSLATFPFNGASSREEYTRINTSRWPEVCSGSEVCLPHLLSAPSVTAISSAKELVISWTTTSHEELYYVELKSTPLNETVTIFVNGSTCVTVSGLPLLESWSARVQGYSPCSGLASYFSGKNNSIGCGSWSAYVKSVEVPSTTVSTSLMKSLRSSRSYPLVASVIVGFFSVAVVVAAAIMVFICLHRKNRFKKFKDGDSGIIPPLQVEALVLYSLSTPEREKIEIETYIVGFLKQKVKVISCNDHTEKTIVQWVEENARRAHAVFIVCNKQFGLDWKMNSRSQLINSLEVIVASAVGQNQIKKFATILLRPADEKYVPDNLYFRGMRSFVIGSRSSGDAKENLLNFIKRNSYISF